MNEQRHNLNEHWTDIITNFIASGLSQKEYAIKNNLKVHSLGYWYRKFNSSFNGFIEVVDSKSNQKNNLKSSIEITFNKIKILINDFYDEELLLKVLRTVKKI